MDGRYEEVYYDKEFETLINFELANPNWEAIFIEYPTEILLIEKTSVVYKVLKEYPLWKLVYEGPVCGVFVMAKDVRFSYILPTTDIDYYKKTAFDNMGKFSNKQ